MRAFPLRKREDKAMPNNFRIALDNYESRMCVLEEYTEDDKYFQINDFDRESDTDYIHFR